MVPLCLIASLLAAAPWLRSFPVSLAGPPVYGAAVLSVLVPLVVVRIRRPPAVADRADRRGSRSSRSPSWWCCASRSASVICGTACVHGPSQILTFALPLVSPRSLMVAPVALVWLDRRRRRRVPGPPVVHPAALLRAAGGVRAVLRRDPTRVRCRADRHARPREPVRGRAAGDAAADARGAGVGAPGRDGGEHPARRDVAAARAGDRRGDHAGHRPRRGARRADDGVPEAGRDPAAGAERQPDQPAHAGRRSCPDCARAATRTRAGRCSA